MRKPLLLTAVIGVGTATAVAYTGIPGADGVIHGCRGKLTGILRVIDTDRGQTCHPKLETPITWNVVGPQGDKGDTGATGPAGPPGPAGAGYTAGAGLDLSEGTFPVEFHVFQVSQSHRLPQGCTGGQVPQKATTGPGWVCGGGEGGAAGSGQAYVARGTADLPVQGDFLVASLVLPAGSYLINGRGDLITSDLDEQPAHCSLFTGDFNAGTAVVLDTSGTWLHEGGEPVTQPVTVVAGASFDDPATVELRCGTYQGSASGVLTAMKVAGIN